MLSDLTAQLQKSKDLSDEHIAEAIDSLTHADVDSETKAAFLIALSDKGESILELAGFAKGLREKAVMPPISDACRQGEILDVCGTGGDHQNTFNISTAVALIAASADIVVAKHGNRAITSKSGSADVLEALGIRIDLSPKQSAQSLAKHHFAFFFAPQYHPAFRHIAEARKLCAMRKKRSIFNYLGPLLNPTKPSAQLLGVAHPDLCEPIAKVLQSLGIRRAMVVCGKSGKGYLDELSTIGDNQIAEFYQEKGFSIQSLDASGFALSPASPNDLKGGDADENAAILKSIFSGDKSPKREAVLLNSAAALFVAGRCDSMIEGWDFSAELIDSGKVSAKLKSLQTT